MPEALLVISTFHSSSFITHLSSRAHAHGVPFASPSPAALNGVVFPGYPVRDPLPIGNLILKRTSNSKPVNTFICSIAHRLLFAPLSPCFHITSRRFLYYYIMYLFYTHPPVPSSLLYCINTSSTSSFTRSRASPCSLPALSAYLPDTVYVCKISNTCSVPTHPFLVLCYHPSGVGVKCYRDGIVPNVVYLSSYFKPGINSSISFCGSLSLSTCDTRYSCQWRAFHRTSRYRHQQQQHRSASAYFPSRNAFVRETPSSPSFRLETSTHFHSSPHSFLSLKSSITLRATSRQLRTWGRRGLPFRFEMTCIAPSLGLGRRERKRKRNEIGGYACAVCNNK